jgi:hypothetical protein
VEAGVQHLVRDALLLLAVVLEREAGQQLGQLLGLLDRDGADQDRLAAHVAVGDLLEDGLVLLALGAIDLIVVVDALDDAVGRDFRRRSSL